MAKADESVTFAINMEDGTSGAAESAAAALKSLRESIKSDTREIGELQKAMKNLQQGSSVNIEQFRQLKTQLDAKKEAVAKAQSAFLDLGGTFKNTNPPTSRFQAFAQQAQQLPGPLGELVGKFGNLKALLSGGAIALGIAAIAVALVAVTAACVAAAVALGKYGLEQANARRGELLQLEGLTKMRNWWGLAAGNAKEMQGAIDRVSGSTTLGRDKLVGYTNELYRMGLRGQNLSYALEAAAIKGSALGEEGAKSAMHWAAGMAIAGGSVKKLADDVKARFGGVVAAQMLDLNVQAAKLRENFALLFTGLKIDDVLTALSGVAQLFSQSTYSGQSLRAIMTELFKPLVSAIDYLGPLVKRFFQGMIISALQVGIVVLKLRNWFREAFGTDTMKALDLTTSALWAGRLALLGVGAAVVLTGALIAGALAAALPFIWGAVAAVGALAIEGLILAAPFLLGAVAIGALLAAGYQLYRLWKEIDWSELGTSIVDGIVNGLKSGAQWVKDAVLELGESAMKTLKATLGIASPSKEFARLGLAVPEGFEQGVRQGTPGAHQAIGELGGDAAPAGGPAPVAGGAGGRGPVSFTFGDIVLGDPKDKSAADYARDFRDQLVRELESVAIQIGAPLGGGAV